MERQGFQKGKDILTRKGTFKWGNHGLGFNISKQAQQTEPLVDSHWFMEFPVKPLDDDTIRDEDESRSKMKL